ncbi:MAG: sulfite exporter TauE/SafE family protein [Myxococcota bacterium]
MVLTETMLALLVGAAFCAGLVDAIAGGGGLITVPALLALGLDPHAVLATNKGQSSFGAATSLATYLKRGSLDRSRLPWGLASGFAGSLLGATLVSLIPPEPLRPVVLLLLGAAAGTMLLRDRLLAWRSQGTHASWAVGVLGLILGAYDGFFGPGTGTLLIAAFVHFFGDGPTRASANAKIINFASNVAALIVFQTRGSILWAIALPMGAANIAGANVGARLALRHGDRMVRVVVLLVVLALTIKVLIDLKR